MFFTLKKSDRPIAVVRGGKHDKKTIYLTNVSPAKESKADITEEEKEENEIRSIMKMLGIKKSEKGKFKHLEIMDGKIEMIPSEERECGYVSGPSGSGKSFFCAAYLKKLAGMYPKMPFILFSKKNHDSQLDDIKNLQRFDMTDLEDLDSDMFVGSCCLFDDIDTLPLANKKACMLLRDQILETGRSNMIYCLSTTHSMCSGKNTKFPLLESHFCTMYPRFGDTYHLRYFMKFYGGLDKKQIEKVLNLNSRSVTLFKRYPYYVLSDHELYLL